MRETGAVSTPERLSSGRDVGATEKQVNREIREVFVAVFRAESLFSGVVATSKAWALKRFICTPVSAKGVNHSSSKHGTMTNR